MALKGRTPLVLLLAPYKQFTSAFASHVTSRDFKSGESSKVPPDVIIPNRGFMNLPGRIRA